MALGTLELDYELEEAGWAKTTFRLGDQSFEFTHGYTVDPLTGLASVAVAMARGGGLMGTSVIFDRENLGTVTATFKNRDPTEFELIESGAGLYDRPEGAVGRVLMAGPIDSVAFAGCVGRVLDGILRSRGLSGYLKSWLLWTFPFREYFLLRLWLDASPIMDKLTTVPDKDAFVLELELLRTVPRWSATRLESRFGDINPYA